jgi:bacterial/archaeal transporter family-2 protein
MITLTSKLPSILVRKGTHPMITQTLLTFGALAIAAGMISPIQQAGLTQMRLAWGGHPGWMLVASFGIGLLASLLWVVASRQSVPDWNTLSSTPLWSWSAGLIAVAFVAAVSLAAPKLGPVMLVMLLIVGQMTASLILEHFGLAGYARNPIDWHKLAGLGAVLVGVVLMRS